MKMKTKHKLKVFIILGVEFLAIALMLVLIFFAGKKQYTVTFDLNGGTLLSGDTVQRVTQGQNATPPQATKEGCYFLKWSGSYSSVTKDTVVEAIWEYETSYGIEYNIMPNSNYCTISGCFSGLQGDVYIGAYNGSMKVLGIEAGAFQNCTGITSIYLLEGLLTIGENAFAGCTSLESIELPETVAIIGKNAFKGCTALKSIALPLDLKDLGEGAFYNCKGLEEVSLPETLAGVGANTFRGCTSLKEMEIPMSVLSLGDSCFRDCTALEKVVLNEGLESIGAHAFYNCTQLAELTVPTTVEFESVGVNAFVNTLLVFDVEYPTMEFPPFKPINPDIIGRLEKEEFPGIGKLDVTIGESKTQDTSEEIASTESQKSNAA